MTQETISLTEHGRKNAAARGLYVHVFNKAVLSAQYVREFAKITGEVCFSDLGDDLLNQRGRLFGVVMRAKPTASFDFDCWSDVDQRGMRFATAKGNPGRNEHWVIPADAELVAVLGDGTAEHVLACQALADALDVPLWSAGMCGWWDAPEGMTDAPALIRALSDIGIDAHIYGDVDHHVSMWANKPVLRSKVVALLIDHGISIDRVSLGYNLANGDTVFEHAHRLKETASRLLNDLY